MQSDPKENSELPTVLVLDDEPFVRHAARRFLKGSGYGCIEAETVDAAKELLRTTPVIAAMLDMRLPDGRTGLDVLTDLRTIPEFREIPVNNLLHWRAICDAKSLGLRRYDFVSSEGGPGRFKKTFGPQPIDMARHWERSPSWLMRTLKNRYEAYLRKRRRVEAES